MKAEIVDEIKDEIMEELWEIKDGLASSCKQDIGKLVERMTLIASRQGRLAEEVNYRERRKTA